MINKIIKKLDLEKNIKLISPIDEIKLSIGNKDLCHIVKTYKSKDPIEKYIQQLLCKEEFNIMNLLSDNYFNNTFGSLYFIIGNPYSIDTKIFDIIYKNRYLIKEISKNIIESYDIITANENQITNGNQIANLHKFYNYDIILRWYKTVISTKLKKSEYFKVSKLSNDNKEKKWEKYNLIWTEYNNSCLELKSYIKKLLIFYKPLKIPVIGCSQLGKKHYEYCLELFLGIKIDPTKLEKWAYCELDKLIDQMKLYIKIVIPSIDTKANYKTLLNKIAKTESQKFKSKKELIELYTQTISKYENIYVNILGFPEFEKPNLVIFDNAKLGGGYYYLNNFYLNVHNWTDMKKYTVESLVLHETVPGHHTQVHTILNKTNKYTLLQSYFWESCTGFIEGWGLFSEKLGFEQTTWDKIGQLEFEIFRTLRIIIDIGLHYNCKTIKQMTVFMENNLSMSHNEIENEIYRYACHPGQAVAYKVGNQVFKKIVEKQSIDNLLEPKAIELYKKLIIDGPKPLKFICQDYGLQIDKLFI